MVCVFIPTPSFGVGMNGQRGGKPSLRFDFGAFFFWLLFFFAQKRKVTNALRRRRRKKPNQF